MPNIKFVVAFVFIALLFFAMHVSAQPGPGKSPSQFRVVADGGLLFGKYATAFQGQVIGGVERHSWFGGLGLGLDDYRFRSLPLFIDVRKSFGKQNNGVYGYADGGINFYTPTSNQKTVMAFTDKFSNGFYTAAGIGYKLRISGRKFIFLDAGYSYKSTTETVYYPPIPLDNITGGSRPVYNSSPLHHHDLARLSIKAGFEF